MKNFKLLPLMFMLVSICSYAQGGRFQEKREQIKSLKVAYITNELDLTADEAQKFWPIYNAYDEKQQSLRQQKLGSYKERMENGSVAKMNDKEANAFLSQMESTEDELYALRKKFVSNLKSVIPAVKILKLKVAEENFNRKLLKQYREKKRTP